MFDLRTCVMYVCMYCGRGEWIWSSVFRSRALSRQTATPPSLHSRHNPQTPRKVSEGGEGKGRNGRREGRREKERKQGGAGGGE